MSHIKWFVYFYLLINTSISCALMVKSLFCALISFHKYPGTFTPMPNIFQWHFHWPSISSSNQLCFQRPQGLWTWCFFFLECASSLLLSPVTKLMITHPSNSGWNTICSRLSQVLLIHSLKASLLAVQFQPLVIIECSTFLPDFKFCENRD